jgi:hypothetical protein
LDVSGGVGGFVVLWSNGAQHEDLQFIKAGLYVVTVTDSAGCQAFKSAAVGEPTAIFVQPHIEGASCFGYSDASIALAVSGGTPGYRYAWHTLDTLPTVTGLSAGNYTVTVTDAHGCDVVRACLVNEPDSMTIVGTVSDPSCFGFEDGSISVTPQGGAPPFSFQWSNGATVAVLEFLDAGAYGLTITESNSCSANWTWTLEEPEALVLETTSTPDSLGLGVGTVTVDVAGGTPPYTFIWDDSLQQTTPTAVQLRPGMYAVTVTDAQGCVADGVGEVQSVVGMTDRETLRVTIHPNPANNVLVITTNQSVHIFATAVDGRRVAEVEATGAAPVIMDVSAWDAGVYMFNLMSGVSGTWVPVVVQ